MLSRSTRRRDLAMVGVRIARICLWALFLAAVSRGPTSHSLLRLTLAQQGWKLAGYLVSSVFLSTEKEEEVRRFFDPKLILPDNSGSVWVGGPHGLSLYDEGRR